MKDFICKKCGNTTYIMQEKLNGTGKAIRLYCAKCGTWHKWLNSQEKVLYSTHSAEIDKDKEIARLTAELEKYKRALSKVIKDRNVLAKDFYYMVECEGQLYEDYYLGWVEHEMQEERKND